MGATGALTGGTRVHLETVAGVTRGLIMPLSALIPVGEALGVANSPVHGAAGLWAGAVLGGVDVLTGVWLRGASAV